MLEASGPRRQPARPVFPVCVVSLHPVPAGYPIPEQTRLVARTAFPHGCLCLHLVDVLGPLYADPQFASLFAPRMGRPAESPARLALVAVLQFVENLSDRQAADAVRSRLDWKYALALELTDPGFDASVLSEFRQRVLDGSLERLLLDTLLDRLRAIGVLKPGGRQRTDSTHVLARTRLLSRMEKVGETLRAALNALATVAPDWLAAHLTPDWWDRYERRLEDERLPHKQADRQQWIRQVAHDGQALLTLLEQEAARPWLNELAPVVCLRQVWQEQFVADPERPGEWRFCDLSALPALPMSTPYDEEARFARKREVEWVGYKVHLTETCDPDAPLGPHLITDVTTTIAPVPDDGMLELVQQSLAARDLLPAEHLADRGYTHAASLVHSQQRGVTLIGPVAASPGWQWREKTGFDKSQFVVDWERRKIRCPQGRESQIWRPLKVLGRPEIWDVRFRARDCQVCPVRAQCTRNKNGGREFRLPTQAEYEALEQRRAEQETPAFRQRYAARAGIEGTQEQAVRRAGLRRSRYIGLAKTHLQHVLTAVALNCIRLAAWWEGRALAITRRSAFAKLRPAAAS